jgi:hypothetical protein
MAVSGKVARRWSEAVARRLIAAVAVLMITASAARSQRPLSGSGTHSLVFGAVFPGVRTSVLRTDATRAGSFDVRGAKNVQVRFDFALPAAMTNARGQSLPLVFGASDGGYATTGTIAAATAFDPRVPLFARLGNTGRLYIWLGGTVVPGSQQGSGTYSATVTMTMAYTGL